MFEFHGWIHVSLPENAKFNEATTRVIGDIIAGNAGGGCLCELRTASNEMRVISIHGLTNHRDEAAFRIFATVAARFPESYGLLHFHDEEHATQDNEFRVLRMVRGTLTECADPFLSPCIPTLEDPYERPSDR